MASRSLGSPSHISGYSAVSYPASLAFSLGQPIMSKSYAYLAPSKNFVNACIVSFVGLLFFMMSFTSPYWLVSYEYTYSDFKNMGLWEFCFDGYRYPKYQFDHKFIGCNYIFVNEYRIIWEWMLPVWLMATQTFMSIALISLMSCMMTCSLVLVRWPMQSIMRYEWHLIGACTLMLAVTVVCLFYSLLVFGIMCWSRDWLLNPNYNYLGWSYYFCLAAGALTGFSGLMMFYETLQSRERKREANNLLQLEPAASQMGDHGPIEIPVDSQYQPPQHSGVNPGYSREQSVYSQASGFSQPSYSQHQHGAYM